MNENQMNEHAADLSEHLVSAPPESAASAGETMAQLPASPGAAQRTQEERTIASLAHASVLLGVLTGGIGGVVAALVIWLAYREKSAYVAFQSLQATAFQGAVLVLGALLGIVVAAAWTISGLLTAVLIGLCLMPGALILTLALLAVPIVALGYGLFGALETYQGRDFRYWLVADMVGG